MGVKSCPDNRVRGLKHILFFSLVPTLQRSCHTNSATYADFATIVSKLRLAWYVRRASDSSSKKSLLPLFAPV